ncbi:MAG: PKD domain-containing protein, partial [Bacteroidota bacterium]
MRMFNFIRMALMAIAGTLLSINAASAQVVVSEGFESTTFPPTGWTLAFNSSGTAIWTRPTTYFYPTCTPHTGVGTARYNSRTSAVGATHTLMSPSFDLSDIGTDTARVSIWVYRNDSALTSYDTLNIMINTLADTTGATNIATIARSIQLPFPDSLGVAGWYQYTFDIPAAFNSSVNYLLFRGVTRSGNNTGFRIYIDDISWDTYPAACNGAPFSGTISTNDTLLCGSGVVRLSNSGATTGQGGLAYQWQYASTSGGPYTDFGTGATTVVSDTVSSTTYFRFLAICTNTGDTAISNEVIAIVDTTTPPVVTISPTAALYCSNSGVPALLVASGADSFILSPTTGLSTSTADSVLATPNWSTTYTVTGYNAAGCRDTATVRVTVSASPTVTVTPAASTVCVGDSITLTATSFGAGTVTYVWSPGGLTGNTIRVPIDSSITYSAVGTSSAGCSGANSTDSTVITANAAPVAVPVSTSDSVVCGGPGTVQLSVGAASAYTIQWFTSNDTLGPWTPTTNQGSSITSDTISVITYFYYVASCPSGLSDTSDITAIGYSPNPAPVVTVNLTQSYYCQNGNPVELIASGAVNYSWTPSTGLSTTDADTVYATPGTSTTYTITGVDSFGCAGSTTTRVSFRTNPIVTVAASATTVCPGDSITLTATATNITGFTTMSYTWEPGTLTGNIITVVVDSAVEYVVTGISNFGCSDTGSVDTADLGVNPLPIAAFTWAPSGTSGTFDYTNTSLYSDTYSWDFGDSTTAADTNTTHAYVNYGSYDVVLIATNSCGTDTFSTVVPWIDTGLPAGSLITAVIYPNPIQ